MSENIGVGSNEQLQLEGLQQLDRKMIAGVMEQLHTLDIYNLNDTGTALYVPRAEQKQWELLGSNGYIPEGREDEYEKQLEDAIHRLTEIIRPLVGHTISAITNEACFEQSPGQFITSTTEYSPMTIKGEPTGLVRGVVTEVEAGIPKGFGDKSKGYPQKGIVKEYHLCMELGAALIPLCYVTGGPSAWNRLEAPR